MKCTKKFIICLAAILMLFTLACNLLNAITPVAEGNNSIIEKPEVLQDGTQEQNQAVEVTEPEAAENAPEPTQPSSPTELVSVDSWSVFVGKTTLTYFNDKDMIPHVVQLNGFVVSAAPSPVGGKVAIVRSDKEAQMGMLWLDILDFQSEQLSTITPLSNDQTVMESWETAEICEPPREANFAITISEPVWRPDGSAVVFISAHEGLAAKPYVYHLTKGQINDLSLGGDAHYYEPSISPDGEFVVVSSAYCFGTGAGFSMDSFSSSRVEGGEVPMTLDVSDASNVITWGWLDNATVVFSEGDAWAKAKHLRAINIFTGNIMEITSPNDYVDNVAVATDRGAILFTTMMSSIADMIEGETITKDALYHWETGMQQYLEINDRVVWGSFVEWNENTQCFYVALSMSGDTADFIQPYTSIGTINDSTCRPLAENVKRIPVFSPSQNYFAWTIYSWDQSAQDGLYTQGFTENQEVRLTDSSVSFAWSPANDILAFAQGTHIYYAESPNFYFNQVLETSEEINNVFWVKP